MAKEPRENINGLKKKIAGKMPGRETSLWTTLVEMESLTRVRNKQRIDKFNVNIAWRKIVINCRKW